MRADAIPYYAYFMYLMILVGVFYAFYFKGWPQLKKAIHPWPFIGVGVAVVAPLYFLPEFGFILFVAAALLGLSALFKLIVSGTYCPACGALRLKARKGQEEEACHMCGEKAVKSPE